MCELSYEDETSMEMEDAPRWLMPVAFILSPVLIVLLVFAALLTSIVAALLLPILGLVMVASLIASAFIDWLERRG